MHYWNIKKMCEVFRLGDDSASWIFYFMNTLSNSQKVWSTSLPEAASLEIP